MGLYWRKVYKYDCNIIATMGMSEKKPVAEKPMEITMLGYEVVEKVAKPCATSARILVPKDWVGKRVRVVRLDP
nr:DUF2080 family transposase-associated protein [Candidatus Freyarchaeota archaeon]